MAGDPSHGDARSAWELMGSEGLEDAKATRLCVLALMSAQPDHFTLPSFLALV